ncbi:unnamed protein product [Allacma fusca]|uniref:CCR4-Not complex component Not1 C-terminal domain-containing protein n=1 Tax=Allacma fusca TaxID=39272 RepID=A0A8J2JZK1_9HEXA|nr:unnamed protein product [Allacma fusca]
MSEENNYSSLSSNNSPRDRRTFSEFATPTTPISTPSYLSSLESSPSSSKISFSDDDYESTSDASVSLGAIFTDRELRFVEQCVNNFSTLRVVGLPDNMKITVCGGFQNLKLFQVESESGCNHGFQVYHEILSRIAQNVHRDLANMERSESKLKYYAPIDNFIELTLILIHLSNLCIESDLSCVDADAFKGETSPRELEKYERTLLFISRLLITLSAHMNKINIDAPGDDVTDTEFPTLAYYRFILGLFKRLVHDRGLQSITSEIVSTFCILLHDISPKSIPIFSYQWLSIVGSGEFLHQVLHSCHPELEVLYSHHLLLLLDYLKPLILCQELISSCVMEYLFGLTRLLLVIHHDFPEFFLRHGFQFIEFVPISNIQLRCIILSTIPPYICPTNPFAVGAFIPSCLDHLEMDLSSFRNNAEFDYHEWCLSQSGMLENLNQYLEERGPMEFLLQLRDVMDSNSLSSDLPRSWREPEMRAVICFTAAAHIRRLTWNWDSLPNFDNLGESSFMDIYQILALALDEHGRALFFSLLVDRLRYPCVETYYFFMVLARLFTTLKNQIVKEQLITSLMQRILANPPHQWGVLAAFTEFIQNPCYNFWNQPFLKRHPSTRLLFDTVSRTWRRHLTHLVLDHTRWQRIILSEYYPEIANFYRIKLRGQKSS